MTKNATPWCVSLYGDYLTYNVPHMNTYRTTLNVKLSSEITTNIFTCLVQDFVLFLM